MFFKKNKKIFFALVTVGLIFAKFSFASSRDLPPQPPAGADLPAVLYWVYGVAVAIGFWSVLIAFAISGAYFALSSVFISSRAKAKDWLSGGISGLIILIFLHLIVSTIYPQLAFFGWNKLPKGSQIQGQTAPIDPGVYLFESTGCKMPPATTPPATPPPSPYRLTSGAPDLSTFVKNPPINSVGFVQNQKSNVSYVAVVFAEKNYYGKCQYLDPNKACSPIDIGQINSAEVFPYNRNPTGSVTFYRNGEFAVKGGFLTLEAGEISGDFEDELKNLHFNGYNDPTDNNIDNCTVPKEQQDCVQWNSLGTCTKKVCPTLANYNIGSIEIDGNYLVVLEYWSGKNNYNDFCQAYPKDSDVSKTGPKQIKWDSINNAFNGKVDYFPNYVLIVPVQKN